MKYVVIILAILSAMLYVLGPWITLFLILLPLCFAGAFLRWLAIVLCVVGLSGCGTVPPAPIPDYVYDGIGIKIDPDVDAPYMHGPGFEADVIGYIARAADYGGSSLAAMQHLGLIVVFTRAGTVCTDGLLHDGCATETGVIYVHAMASLCYSTLSHEALHVALQDWDALHSDPRWATYQDDLHVEKDTYCSAKKLTESK